jgi:glycosyltransferase involved in cell wall biosynthesis
VSTAVATKQNTAPTDELAVLAAARSLPFHGIGGMQAIAWDVLAGLAQRGHRVTVLTTSIPGRACDEFEHDGVTVVPLQGTTPGRYSSAWWLGSRRRAQHLGKHIDAVLSVSSAAAGLLPLKHSVLRVPFVFQAHGSSWAEALAKWRSSRPLDWLKSTRNVYWLAQDARLYRGFDELVFVGDALRRHFEEPPLRWMTRGIARTTIVNGVDTDRFRFDARARARARLRYALAAEDRVLVFAARLHPHKGAAEAVRALAVLRARDRAHKLLIVGDGAEAPELRALADQLGCGHAVAFAGAVPRDAVPALLAAGDVFVFPALGREGLPLSVLEALSVGLPCVCADSLREIFGTLSSIEYAPARDPNALAAAIERTELHAPPAATLLPEEYSLSRCIDAYEAVLRRSTRH